MPPQTYPGRDAKRATGSWPQECDRHLAGGSMCEHERRRIQSIERVCSNSKHWWLRSQCKEYGAASSSASPVRVALLLVILASRAGDACISHSGCAARKWCDDTHRCQPCAEWTNRDMGASITGTAPSTCPGPRAVLRFMTMAMPVSVTAGPLRNLPGCQGGEHLLQAGAAQERRRARIPGRRGQV